MKPSTAKAPFPWFGGKQKLAETICDLMPPHAVYVEVFGGGGSVLLSKAPATLDVYNDIEGGLVNFYRCLRDHPERLVALLELTPYAREEFEAACETWRDVEDDVERARRFYVVASQSFGAHIVTDDGSSGRGWGGERLGRMHLSRAASTANRVDNIWRFVDRLRRVQIDQMDWRSCLERYDNPDVVFYLDPPYVPATRRAGRYSHELTPEEHTELVARISALEGHAIVSGYDHPIYEGLSDAGFERREVEVWATAGARSVDRARDRRTEILWHRPTPQLSLLAEEPAA